MKITYKTSVVNARSWRIIINDNETFRPSDDNTIEFTRETSNPVLKVLYIISAINGTDIEINYKCSDSAGKIFSDSQSPSPVKKRVPNSNRTQVTLNIPLT